VVTALKNLKHQEHKTHPKSTGIERKLLMEASNASKTSEASKVVVKASKVFKEFNTSGA
jgi:hypothetical protein